jgi:hypothetical protein
MGGTHATDEEIGSGYKIFVRRPEGKKPLGKHESRCKNNFKIDIKEVGCGDMH